MLFSVLMCCNSDHGHLEPAIQSVLKQTHKEFELLVVLNNCDQEVEDTVKSIDDSRIIVYRNLIGQLSYNLNFGVERSRGEYIVRMDADDLCEPTRLAITADLIGKFSYPDVIAGSAETIDENGERIGKTILKPERNWRRHVRIANPFIHPAVAIKRSLLLRHRGYLGGFQSEDYDLWLRISRDPSCVIVQTDHIFIKYRISRYQARGNMRGYAESSGYMMRDFILFPSVGSFVSIIIATCKAFLFGKR